MSERYGYINSVMTVVTQQILVGVGVGVRYVSWKEKVARIDTSVLQNEIGPSLINVYLHNHQWSDAFSQYKIT